MLKLLHSSKQLLDGRDETLILLAVLLIPVCTLSGLVGI